MVVVVVAVAVVAVEKMKDGCEKLIRNMLTN